MVKLRLGMGVGVETSLFVSTLILSCSLFRRCVVTVFEEMEGFDCMDDSFEIDGTIYKETGEGIPSLSLDGKLCIGSSFYTINRIEKSNDIR